MRDGVFYPTRFAALQGALIPVTPHDSLVLHRPKASGRRGPRAGPTQQLWLFELIHTASGNLSLARHTVGDFRTGGKDVVARFEQRADGFITLLHAIEKGKGQLGLS